MRKDMIVHEVPKSPVSESIRTLRTSIMHKMNNTGAKSFLITSASTQDGKSFIVSNLAIAFSQSKNKVLIIDCDLRRSRQNSIFGVNNIYGLSQALDNKYINSKNSNLEFEVTKLIKQTEIPNVDIIHGGVVPHNPSELFENPQFDLILKNVRNKYDIIIMDAPPINLVSDSMTLCTKADGVIMVCAIEKSKSDALLETKRKIESMGGNIIGVVVNRMPMDKMKEYAKDYSGYNEDGQIIKYDNSFRRKGIS